jgi:uncharacterized membrane protein YdjX (TVP38/TMEM64 family)
MATSLSPVTPPAPPASVSQPSTAAWRRCARRVLGARSVRWLVLIGLVGWPLVRGLEWMGGPDQIRADYGLAAAGLLVPLQAVVAVSPVPSEVLALATASIYGLTLGSGLVWVGWMLGAGLEYGLYRRAASELSELGGLDRLPGWVRRLPVAHPIFLIVVRWLPLGNHLVNAVAGACRVPLWRFTWTSAVALLPFSILIGAIGSGIVAR